MGIDLQLLPFDGDSTVPFSHTILSCLRRSELFEKIMDLDALPTPEDFYCYLSTGEYGESCYGVVTEDPYGERLTYTHVSLLMRFAQDEGVIDNYQNRAIWAYLAALPLNTKVALFWN